MTKKRKQAVGHDISITTITSREALDRYVEDIKRTVALYARAARWKAAAKQWRQMANEYWLVLDKEKADD